MPARAALTVLLLVLLAGPARARPAPPVPDIEALLYWQDRQVLTAYASMFPISDARWEAILTRVSRRLQGQLPAVFGAKAQGEVQYFVYPARMGFNAQAWHRLIIFDSLLLDALRGLANGVAVHGRVNHPWVQSLAVAVARASALVGRGMAFPDLANPGNPYNLPILWGIPPAQRDAADALFEEMLAAWMAHEVSHCFLEHARDRAEGQRLTILYQQGQVPDSVLREHMNRFMSYDLGRQKELEADAKGVELLLRAGYGLDGFLRTVEFSEYLETLSGETHNPYRTHPTPTERLKQAYTIRDAMTAPR